MSLNLVGGSLDRNLVCDQRSSKCNVSYGSVASAMIAEVTEVVTHRGAGVMMSLMWCADEKDEGS